MASLTCEVTSLVLNTPVTLRVILPTSVDYHRLGEPLSALYTPETYRVLYFLHGAISDPGQILRYSNIERYAEECRLAVVMPYVGNSFYTDVEERFYSYVAEELPLLVNRLFPISTRREDTYIGGFSMGGYGAMKIGLRHPARYGRIASLSGVLDLAGEMDSMTAMGLPVERLFGAPAQTAGGEEDVMALLQSASLQGSVPPIYQSVGREDFLYGANQRFRQLCEACHLTDYHYEESDGAHDWEFWDGQIRRMMYWMIGE